MEKHQAYFALLARVLMAAGFLMFGYTKLFVFGAAGTAQYLGSVYHAPLPTVAAWVAIVIEILGGLAILLGFKTRWAAAVLALWCLFTGLGFHLPIGDAANLSGLYKNLVMAGGFVYVLAYGPGSISVDHAMGGEKAA